MAVVGRRVARPHLLRHKISSVIGLAALVAIGLLRPWRTHSELSEFRADLRSMGSELLDISRRLTAMTADARRERSEQLALETPQFRLAALRLLDEIDSSISSNQGCAGSLELSVVQMREAVARAKQTLMSGDFGLVREGVCALLSAAKDNALRARKALENEEEMRALALPHPPLADPRRCSEKASTTLVLAQRLVSLTRSRVSPTRSALPAHEQERRREAVEWTIAVTRKLEALARRADVVESRECGSRSAQSSRELELAAGALTRATQAARNAEPERANDDVCLAIEAIVRVDALLAAQCTGVDVDADAAPLRIAPPRLPADLSDCIVD